MDLVVDSGRREGVAVITVHGDVDLASGPPLAGAIAKALGGEHPAPVEVDLSGVTFLDSSGISTLLKGRRMADTAGVGYRVVGAQGMALRVLELTGVWEHLHGPVT